MIIFDTETTGLVQPSVVPLDQQPRIIEFAAIKTKGNDIVCEIEFKLNPGIKLSPEITKITGLMDKDLENMPCFADKYVEVAKFFLGEDILVAHNCSFDVALLSFALQRIGKGCQFPWPYRHICTVEATHHIKNRRMKLTEVYEHYFGVSLAQKHRAMDDVKDLWEVVKKLKLEGLI